MVRTFVTAGTATYRSRTFHDRRKTFSINGQHGYFARRGRFGRWHFTPMILE
jgi:hypothetical protein